MRVVAFVILSLICLQPGLARLDRSVCGTYRDRGQEELHLHRQARARRKGPVANAIVAPAASLDVGDIAILEDSGDIIGRRNDFNLDRKTIQFSPVGGDTARYRFQTSGGGYDAAAAAAGSPLSSLGDDDSASVDLPFAF